MSEQSASGGDDLREQAREYVENLPGETALGRVDPDTVPAGPGDADAAGTGSGDPEAGGTGTVGGPVDAAGGEVGGGTAGAAGTAGEAAADSWDGHA